MQPQAPTTNISTKLLTKFATGLSGNFFNVGKHCVTVLALLLTPAATFAETFTATEQTISVIETGSHIEQRSTNPVTDYNHCHFDDAHQHLHCYTDQVGHQCDQGINQQPNTITRTTRRYNEPTTIVERHYYNNTAPRPNIILGYNITRQYRSNPYYGLRPGLFLGYNNFRYNNNRYRNNRYRNTRRHDYQHKKNRSNQRGRNRDNH
jgi:hypothetical protein